MIGPLNLHLQMAHECKKGTAVQHRQGGFSVWAEGVRRHLIQVYVSCLRCQGLQEVKMSIVFQIIDAVINVQFALKSLECILSHELDGV